jgi:hypothetical protein
VGNKRFLKWEIDFSSCLMTSNNGEFTGKHKFMNLSQAIEETWNFNQAEAKHTQIIEESISLNVDELHVHCGY